jgi:hypothetical protein
MDGSRPSVHDRMKTRAAHIETRAGGEIGAPIIAYWQKNKA